MKVLNVLWAFGTGGIAKLFLTYSKLGNYDPSLEITSVCIDLQNCDYDRSPLHENNISVIVIKNRLDFSWISRLGKVGNEVKPDVIFCHGFNGPIVIKLASIFNISLRKPIVCTYHGLYNPPIASRKYLATCINRTQAWMYKKYAFKVLLVSKYSGEYLLSRDVPKEKLQVIYNGISDKKELIEPLNLSFKGIKIGFVGRLDSIKGITYLIEAIPLIKKKAKKDFHIYIVGDGPERFALQKLVESLDVVKDITFLGYQNNISSWLASWDIFCLPSLQENHSIALLEAMKAKVAIVCTNVGGNPETVQNEKEALLINSKSSTEIAEALSRLIESSDLREFLSNNAYLRFTSSFTEDIMKQNLCDVLKSAKS